MLKLNHTMYFDDNWDFDLHFCCFMVLIWAVQLERSEIWTHSDYKMKISPEKNGLRYRFRTIFIGIGFFVLFSAIRISAFSMRCVASSVWCALIQSLILKTAKRAENIQLQKFKIHLKFRDWRKFFVDILNPDFGSFRSKWKLEGKTTFYIEVKHDEKSVETYFHKNQRDFLYLQRIFMVFYK